MIDNQTPFLTNKFLRDLECPYSGKLLTDAVILPACGDIMNECVAKAFLKSPCPNSLCKRKVTGYSPDPVIRSLAEKAAIVKQEKQPAASSFLPIRSDSQQPTPKTETCDPKELGRSVSSSSSSNYSSYQSFVNYYPVPNRLPIQGNATFSFLNGMLPPSLNPSELLPKPNSSINSPALKRKRGKEEEKPFEQSCKKAMLEEKGNGTSSKAVEHSFHFGADLFSKDLQCPVSKHPLINAVTLLPCAHPIEESEAVKHFQGMSKKTKKVRKKAPCPVCNKDVTKYLPHQLIRSLAIQHKVIQQEKRVIKPSVPLEFETSNKGPIVKHPFILEFDTLKPKKIKDSGKKEVVS